MHKPLHVVLSPPRTHRAAPAAHKARACCRQQNIRGAREECSASPHHMQDALWLRRAPGEQQAAGFLQAHKSRFCSHEGSCPTAAPAQPGQAAARRTNTAVPPAGAASEIEAGFLFFFWVCGLRKTFPVAGFEICIKRNAAPLLLLDLRYLFSRSHLRYNLLEPFI